MALNLSAFQKNIQPKKKTNLNLSAFGITQEKTQQPAQPQSVWRNIPTATDWRKTLPMSIAKPQEQPKQNLLQSAVSGITNLGKGATDLIVNRAKEIAEGVRTFDLKKDWEETQRKNLLVLKADKGRKLTDQEKKEVAQIKKERADLAIVAAMGMTEPLKGVGKIVKPAVETGTDALATEARKYKTAEEFVKAQGKPVYHQSQSKVPFTKFRQKGDIGYKKAYYSQANEGIYFSPNKELVISKYGKYNGIVIESIVIPKKKLDLGNYDAMYFDGRKVIYGDIINQNFKREMQGLKPLPEPDIILTGISKKAKNWLEKNGYDAVEGMKGEMWSAPEIVVLDKSIIKTKSQLTDIWNEANKKTATSGLPELGKADDLIWARGTRAAGIQNAGLKNYNLATKALEKAGELPSEIKSDKITKDFIKNYYETKKPPVVGDVFINGKGEKIEITKIKDNVVDYFLKGKKKGIFGSIYADNKFLKPKEIKPATSGLPELGKTNDLFQEARKYKTADEITEDIKSLILQQGKLASQGKWDELSNLEKQINKLEKLRNNFKETKIDYSEIPLYHGTQSDVFTKFDLKQPSSNTQTLMRGVFFFTKKEPAINEYGKNIIEAKAKIKNPLIVDGDRDWNSLDFQREIKKAEIGLATDLGDYIISGNPKRYDAIIIKNANSGYGYGYGNGFDEVIIPANKVNNITIKSQLTDIWNQANKKTAKGGLPALPKLPTKKDLSLKQTTPAVKKPQELTTQPTPRGEATPIEAKAPRIKSTLNTPAEAISNSESQILDYAGQKVDVSLDNIIDQMPTPVKRKVNAVDWLIRTPEKVLRKIGLGKEMDNLRKGYDAYLKELPKNIDKITEWTKQVPTKENNQNIFLYLDGQDVKLNPTELKVAGEIKTWLSEWADRLKLPKDNRITHYITHLFDEQLIKKEFDEDLAKIISQKIPGSVYDPFLIKRLGAKGYKVDTWAALDAYVKRGTRKVNLDPALEKIDEIAPSLEQSQWDYLKEYIDRVNLRPTKIDTSIDNTIKSVVGYKFGQRPTAMISRVMRQAGYRGGLWFNVSSTLRNLSQGINTYAVLGEKYTALGYAKLFSKANRQEIIDQGVLNAGFIDDRILSATQKLWQKADNVGFAMFQAVEGINRGSAYLGAKAKALSMGKTEAQAIEYGKKIARETQFTFGSIDTPLAFSNDIVKTLMQFQTYTTKQVEFLSELAKDRNFGALARYTAAGLLYVATIGQAFGMDWKELIPAWRLPAPPAGKFLATTAGAILNAPDKYGNQRDFPKKLKDIAATAWGIVPGGSQAKKTIQGYQSIQEGGSYDAAGRLQFNQDQSTAGQLQSLLFGKYAGQNAQNYFDKKGIKTKESGLPALPKLPKLPTLPKLPQL